MTKEELSQLYYLKLEIADDERRLMELEDEATRTTANMSGMPGGGKISDKTGIAVKIADLRSVIEAKNERCIDQYIEIMRFVSGIDDSLIRQIITYRHIDMMKWREIAQKIGGNNSEDGLRMDYERFLQKS